MKCCCIDEYITLKQESVENRDTKIDPKIAEAMMHVFKTCTDKHQLIGLAVETLRFDILRDTLDAELLEYTFELAQEVQSLNLRRKILEVVIDFARNQDEVDYALVCQSLQMLDEAQRVADILKRLIDSNVPLAFQIAFDLVQNENQRFLQELMALLPTLSDELEAMSFEDVQESDSLSTQELRILRLKHILKGNVLVGINLDFLCRNNHTDLMYMAHIKKACPKNNSMMHNYGTLAHGFMFSGTTADQFIRDNLDWFKEATHWGQFSAVGSMGLIHKGHFAEAMTILGPFMPPQDGGPSRHPYAEGGSLYALGLIHANQGGNANSETLTYLRNMLASHEDKVIQHGACLGLGLAGMGTGNDEMYSQLRNLVFQNDAVAGAAGALAIGLILAGKGPMWVSEQSGEEAVQELLNYAHDTKHIKIIQAIGNAIALMCYGHEETADPVIEQLLQDSDPYLRCAGVNTIAMAFAGSGNSQAIKKLLHVGVSDVSDDVRRCAVIAMSFILFKNPEKVPDHVRLLCESFNSQVRYASCIALGVGCAGTENGEALKLVEPLLKDGQGVVRQGAMLAKAMILMQAKEGKDSEVSKFRKFLDDIIMGRRSSLLLKTGATMAMAILNAGGRNVTLKMASHAGFNKMASIVGVMLWSQHWDWFPLMHFLGLAFTPTCMIGLDETLKMPAGFKATCHNKPSVYAYPEFLKKEDKKETTEIKKVELSAQSDKEKSKLMRRKLQRQKSVSGTTGGATLTPMADASTPRVDVVNTPKPKPTTEEDMDVDSEERKKSEDKKSEEETKEEPTEFTIESPCRITAIQQKQLSFDQNARFVPVLAQSVRNLGIVMLRDSNPSSPADYVEFKGGAVDDEPQAPEPFEWTPPAEFQ
eukprot:TRINITY_DN8291_c0_g1_i1.p1 TRINITY_DN8291_c0_g1~~TRINITY_DN8291_c0_g1_i1.p1  ORF type:complete len:985 (+),score=346.19 TRINITY_DN8291_c0_g1_i1:331-2955(+)